MWQLHIFKSKSLFRCVTNEAIFLFLGSRAAVSGSRGRGNCGAGTQSVEPGEGFVGNVPQNFRSINR